MRALTVVHYVLGMSLSAVFCTLPVALLAMGAGDFPRPAVWQWSVGLMLGGLIVTAAGYATKDWPIFQR